MGEATGGWQWVWVASAAGEESWGAGGEEPPTPAASHTEGGWQGSSAQVTARCKQPGHLAARWLGSISLAPLANLPATEPQTWS